MAAFQRNPFLLPLLAVLAGMTFEISLPGPPFSYWPAVLLAPMLGWVCFGTGRRVHPFWITGAGGFFLGGFWLSLHPLPLPPPANAQPGERVAAEGCVDSTVTRTPERLQFLLRTPQGARIQVGVYPRPGETAPEVQFGQPVEVEGRIRPPRNFRNPGSFDYERFLARKDVFWMLSATGVEHLRLIDDRCGSPALGMLHDARRFLLRRLELRYQAQPEARAWLSAILLGDDSLLSEDTLEQYRLAGVYHVLVISGQHVAILAAAFLLCFRLARFPRWLRFLLTVLGCWGYALVAGYEVPALRAACAVTLYLAGSLAFRRSRPLNLLALIALLFLAWDPGQLLDASFQLSFLAVLAIAGIAIPLQHRLFGSWPAVAHNLADTGADLRVSAMIAEARVELRLLARTVHLATRMPERGWQIALSLAVHAAGICGTLLLFSLVVQVVLTPLLVQDFHRAPLIAPLANLILSPILAVIVPLAFVDLALPVPGAQQVLAIAIDLTNRLIAMIAVSMPDLRVPDIPPLLLLLATGGVTAAILLWEPQARHASTRERREIARDNAVATPPLLRGRTPLLVAAAILLTGTILIHPFAPKAAAGEMELTMLDVGQGDATLVIAPDGTITLVDTGGLGGYSASTRLDTGEDIVAPYLWRRGIQRIDTLVLSHFDFDHAGGAPAILRIFRPRSLWLPMQGTAHPLLDRVLAAAKAAGVETIRRSSGETWEAGGITWRALHPSGYRTAGDGRAERSNEASLVLHAQVGASSVLFTGDIQEMSEQEMILRGDLPHADVLKVAHHGSRTSTSGAFLDAVAPSIALVSAGWLNSYGHPNAIVTARLQSHGIALFRTDRDGAITLRSDGRHWRYYGTQ
ncbi:MAG: ComEC/Rec2 family competence protein [Bryobacterales bacterium]|nr:ComEC/Rec2 family competence protein [Bryobacterales bacterium]